jgi:predicted kinase
VGRVWFRSLDLIFDIIEGMKYKINDLFLLIIHGPMGSGKTTLADLLHDEIENMAHFGVDHIKWLISDGKTNPKRREVNKQMVEVMTSEYLKLGTSVLVEQAFDRKEIDELKDIANENNVKFLVYKLETDRQVMNERIKERTKKSNKPEVSKEHIEKSYEEYKSEEYVNSVVFDSGKITVREMADKILKDLGV